MSMKAKNNENLIFSHTNKSNYTITIIVTRITDKSVFYRDYPRGKMEFRMSKKSFEQYHAVSAL